MDPVESVIRQEILSAGQISFARFMELALYCPKTGYYERPADPIGSAGDFYTSVSAGSLFGELLACQFAIWLRDLRHEQPFLVEAGAHNGQLAADILAAMARSAPDLPVRYLIVEPSEHRQRLQRARLDLFAGQVSWFATFADLPDVSGIIFANELLDAMPVHVLRWRKVGWVERAVTLANDQFAWVDAPLTVDTGPPSIPNDLAAVLPEGFQIEASPAATQWWGAAARKLNSGKLVTIDYGGEWHDLMAPHRVGGTLRSYRGHQIVEDVLAHSGEQDITAHVNFSEIKRAGELEGLRTELFTSQARFLTPLVGQLANWAPARSREFQTLTHPDHLGRAFKVLVQSR
jgi:SAM-dependent MidA family methyltransferase